MSSKRGDTARSRGQRYQNKFAFKNDLHDSSEKIKKLNSMSITEVCTKCKDVIEWKIKYRKYKPLTQPGICNRCNQRKVRKAYHVLCHDCAMITKQCAKCLKTDAEIIPPEPTLTEKIKMDNEMKQMVKALSERKRRTFFRFMKGKKKSNKSECDEELSQQPDIPQPSKDELMLKLEQLNVANDEDDDFYDDILSSDEEGWASELSN